MEANIEIDELAAHTNCVFVFPHRERYERAGKQLLSTCTHGLVSLWSLVSGSRNSYIIYLLCYAVSIQCMKRLLVIAFHSALPFRML